MFYPAFIVSTGTEAALNITCTTNYNGFWSNNSNSCFLLYSPPINQTNQWTQALSLCTALGKINNGLFARLGHVYNASVWNGLSQWLLSNENFTTDGAWFGLYRASGPASQIGISDWRWVNNLGGFQLSLTTNILNNLGVSMNYSTNNTVYCAKIINSTYWTPVLCSQTLPYLCELYGKIKRNLEHQVCEFL